MKTPDEIKKGLWHCEREKCKGCPYHEECMHADAHTDLHADALEYIQQLENQIGELTEKVAQLEAAQSAAETFRRERDALLSDLKQAAKMDCSSCEAYQPDNSGCEKADYICSDCDLKNCVCHDCIDNSKYKWRGVKMDDEARD